MSNFNDHRLGLVLCLEVSPLLGILLALHCLLHLSHSHMTKFPLDLVSCLRFQVASNQRKIRTEDLHQLKQILSFLGSPVVALLDSLLYFLGPLGHNRVDDVTKDLNFCDCLALSSSGDSVLALVD